MRIRILCIVFRINADKVDAMLVIIMEISIAMSIVRTKRRLIKGLLVHWTKREKTKCCSIESPLGVGQGEPLEMQHLVFSNSSNLLSGGSEWYPKSHHFYAQDISRFPSDTRKALSNPVRFGVLSLPVFGFLPHIA